MRCFRNLLAAVALALVVQPALAGHHVFGGYRGHGGPGFAPIYPPMRCGQGYRGRSTGLALGVPLYAGPIAFATPPPVVALWPIPALAMLMPNLPAANFNMPIRLPANALLDRGRVLAASQARTAPVVRPAVAAQRVTLGQRLFRAGNNNRAVMRYQQAAQANPKSAAPWVGLSQVALSRGRYAEAASNLRKAQAAEPGWLAHAPDVEAMYGEPADFAKQVAKLESHLQLHPNDRDAWLVLGAQYYLSGRTRQAADVFLRLDDRPADETLAAFLEASGANRQQGLQ